MLKRPESLVKDSETLSLRNKFNNTLEMLLSQGKSHFEQLILSIDVGEEFNVWELDEQWEGTFLVRTEQLYPQVRTSSDQPEAQVEG